MARTQFLLKPSRPGLIVRDPKTMKPLDAEGELKPANSVYWLRRLADGDVLVIAAEDEKGAQS